MNNLKYTDYIANHQKFVIFCYIDSLVKFMHRNKENNK